MWVPALAAIWGIDSRQCELELGHPQGGYWQSSKQAVRGAEKAMEG